MSSDKDKPKETPKLPKPIKKLDNGFLKAKQNKFISKPNNRPNRRGGR